MPFTLRHTLARFVCPVIVGIIVFGLPACRSGKSQPDIATDVHVRESTVQITTRAADDEMETLVAADDPMVSSNTLLDAPDDYALARIDTADYPVPQYAKYLKGVRICLDPGHGGDAHKRRYKRGPTGVREAEVNLRVALYLRDLLEHVGAEVWLTRDEDVDLSLEERANVANYWPADLFISCHHNAIGGKPQVNYTTVWHHATVDTQPASLDLARHLCHGLMDALDFEQITSVPLKSDQLMYENGFAVLRHARVPAALCETSFYTNPEEEQRLRDPAHNLREAYGMFLGLAWYAYGGLPRAELVEPADGVMSRRDRQLVFALDDGLRSRGAWGSERQMILSDTIVARLGDARLDFEFVNESSQLTVYLPDDIATGEQTITLHFANMFKNSVLNPDFVIDVK